MRSQSNNLWRNRDFLRLWSAQSISVFGTELASLAYPLTAIVVLEASVFQIGVLQAVGGLHGQIRRTIWLEALSIGVLGLALGFSLGAVNLYYILQIVHHDIAGMRLDYVFPVGTVLALVPTILGAAFIAAIWPAESAVHGSLVEALEYE